MYSNSFSFVVPAFNEEGNIEKTVRSAYLFLSSNFPLFEIIVVDDGSSDGTPRICQQLKEIYKDKLTIFRHEKNRGYGAALRTGLFGARYELVFYTDADNQFDISEIVKLMEYIASYDMVIGYRKNRQDAWRRKFTSRAYNRLIYFLFGLDVHDIDCSFKLFKKPSLQKLSIARDQFFVDTELLLRAQLLNFKIKELPVTHLPRTAGKSTVKFKHVFATLKDIWCLYSSLKKVPTV